MTYLRRVGKTEGCEEKMTFANAKKLQNGDEVIIKCGRRPFPCLKVVEVLIEGKNVFAYCEDGNSYHHRELK